MPCKVSRAKREKGKNSRALVFLLRACTYKIKYLQPQNVKNISFGGTLPLLLMLFGFVDCATAKGLNSLCENSQIKDI